MADQRLKDLSGSGRRAFLKWSATAAAAIGLERSRFLDALSGVAGTAMADSASCSTTNKSVHFVAGSGGFANWTLIFPHIEQATVNNANYAFHTPGQGKLASGTTKPWAYAAESPFQSLPRSRQMTGLMGGTNEAHTATPSSAAMLGGGTGMIAACAAIQQANPTLLPVIGITPLVFGTAPGAPAVATVANAAGLISLFDSVASKTLLKTSSNAALHEAYYKAFLGLNAAAGRTSVAKGYETGKISANLLGQNLAQQLKPTAADLTLYGIDGTSSTALADQANALITGLKAFKLGLTSALIIPSFRDDPHGMFSGGDSDAQKTAAAIGKMLDAFMTQASQIPDPSCSAKSLADNIVITVHGDTPKDPLQRSGWPDGTPQNSNWLYVFGNGYLKTGWFGGVKASGVTTFDPGTGNESTADTATTANAAAAAAAYAVAKGDMRRVQDFYKGPSIAGVVNLQQL